MQRGNISHGSLSNYEITKHFRIWKFAFIKSIFTVKDSSTFVLDTASNSTVGFRAVPWMDIGADFLSLIMDSGKLLERKFISLYRNKLRHFIILDFVVNEVFLDLHDTLMDHPGSFYCY